MWKCRVSREGGGDMCGLLEPCFIIVHERCDSCFSLYTATSHISTSRYPSTGTVYTGDTLHLICMTRLNQVVDTAVRVTHLWTGPGGVVTSGSGVRVSTVTQSGQEYNSTVTFTSLHSSHSGTYTCSSTVSPAQSTAFIVSGTETANISFRAGNESVYVHVYSRTTKYQ